MKRTLLIIAASVCGAVGALLFLAALAFRVEPPELAETQVLDLFIGVLLGVAIWALLHFLELPRTRSVRQKLSLISGILVCLCAGGFLIAWHRIQLAERERNARAAAAAAVTRTNVPASRPLEEIH